MLLRGQVPRDQLQFNSEIEKTAQNNRRRKKKSKQGAREEPSASPHIDIKVNQEENMAERDKAPPPTTRHVEMKTAFLNLISVNQFTGMDNEDPYSHLATFYELVGTMGFEEGDTEYAYLRLFPFSLARKAKEWLKSHPNQSLTS